MREIEHLLTEAIARYRAVLDAFDRIEESVGKVAGKVLQKMVESLDLCQSSAQQIDQALVARVGEKGSHVQSLPLLREYRNLLSQASERNRSLLEKARVHRALFAAELVELKAGKTALAGYRLPSEARGTVLAKRS